MMEMELKKFSFILEDYNKNPGVSHPRGNGKNPRTVKEKTSIHPDRVARTKIKTDGTVIKTEENVGLFFLM